jgi:hypothetical protein
LRVHTTNDKTDVLPLETWFICLSIVIN